MSQQDHVHVLCPSCQTKLKVKASRLGLRTRCPRCNDAFVPGIGDILRPGNHREHQPGVAPPSETVNWKGLRLGVSLLKTALRINLLCAVGVLLLLLQNKEVTLLVTITGTFFLSVAAILAVVAVILMAMHAPSASAARVFALLSLFMASLVGVIALLVAALVVASGSLDSGERMMITAVVIVGALAALAAHALLVLCLRAIATTLSETGLARGAVWYLGYAVSPVILVPVGFGLLLLLNTIIRLRERETVNVLYAVGYLYSFIQLTWFYALVSRSAAALRLQVKMTTYTRPS